MTLTHERKKWSRQWQGSKRPGKQRAYKGRAPLHIAGKFMSSHLSKELRQKHSMRSIRIRPGDTITVMRGQFKKKTGKVDRVDAGRQRVYITGVALHKKDGGTTLYPLHPSNIMITELNMTDKRRLGAHKKQKSAEENEKTKINAVEKSKTQTAERKVY